MAISVDRIHGVAGGLAIKAPVRVATTAHISHSGLPIIDGVQLVDQDRVLDKDNNDPANRGIWVATTSDWSRALDFNGALDVVQGTFVRVTSGTTNQRTMWELTTASPVVGTSSLTFALANDVDLAAALAGTGPGQGADIPKFKRSGAGALTRAVKDRVLETFSLRDYMVCDGVADDAAGFQRLMDDLADAGGGRLRGDGGLLKVKINSPVIIRPTVAQAAALSGSDLFFSDLVSFNVCADDNIEIIAGAAMTQMFLLQFAGGNIAPFFTTVEGFHFNGNSLATTAIKSDFCMAARIRHNRIRGVTNGIDYLGYGVADISHNTIKANICINFSGGGGDSLLNHNDFFPLASGTGVRLAKLSGNTTISNSIFNGEGLANIVGVTIDGTSALSTDEIRDVRVLNNEFSGCISGVSATRHSGGRNIYRITVKENHTTPAAGGAVHTGELVNFNGVDDAIIVDNAINGLHGVLTLTTAPGIQLTDCRRPTVRGNKGGNLLGPAVYMTTTTDGVLESNEFDDVGQAGAGNVIWDVDTGCTGNTIARNILRQSSAAFAQNSIFERAGANTNEILENKITGANRVTRVGAASVVVDRVVAQGSYSLSGGTATLNGNSHGFTVVRTAAGVCTVTLATARPDANYRVSVTADAPQAAVDTYTTTTFIVRTFNAAGVALDAVAVNVEVRG